MLDFKIDTFLAVCRHMNFTRAAEELNITQPGVSRHIHQLEEEYGVRLFEFEGKKAALTPAGHLILEAAQTVKHDDRFLRDQLSRLAGGERQLHFGATLTAGAYVMPGAISGYLALHPHARVRMEVANTHSLLERLDEGRLDFAIVEGFFDKDAYAYRAYCSEPYMAVCAPDYPLASTVNKLADLLSERLIIREPGSGTRTVLEKHLELQNLALEDFEQVMEISNIDAIKKLVMAGCGVTFLYGAAVREELDSGRLCQIPLKDFAYVHDFTFLWRKNSVFPERYDRLFYELGGGPADRP